MLFHWDYSDVCLVMAVGSWVLERMPRDKCHLTTSHQRITPSTRPHAAEADWGSGWQMLVRSPCCQFFFFPFTMYLFVNTSNHHNVHFKYLIFLFVNCTSRKSEKDKCYWLIFFYPVFHTALWSPVTLNSPGYPKSREPTWITWNCSAQWVHLFSPPIYLSFTQALSADRAGNTCAYDNPG